MARHKHYNYSQRVLIPISLEEQLMPGTLEFAIHILVETRLDTSIFDSRHKNDETGCPAYDPKVLLKVVLLAYSRGIISSRRIEKTCRENVIFMAVSCKQCPDHSTIAGFVSSMRDEILPLFRDVLLVCEEMKLLGGTVLGWMAASSPPMPRQNGVEPSRISKRSRRKLRARSVSFSKSRFRPIGWIAVGRTLSLRLRTGISRSRNWRDMRFALRLS